MNRFVYRLLLFLLLGLGGLTAVSPTHAQAILLPQAIADGSVVAEIVGIHPSYAQPMLRLTLTNQFVTPLTLEVPLGLHLNSNEAAFADILIGQAQTVNLEANETKEVLLLGYSLDHHRAFPSPAVAYTVRGQETNAELLTILNRITQENVAEAYASQLAIWMQVSGLNYNRLAQDLGSDPLEEYQRLTLVLLSESPFAVWRLALGENLWWLAVIGGLAVAITAVLLRHALHMRVLDGKYQIIGERLRLDGYYEHYKGKRLWALDREPLLLKIPADEQCVPRCEREIEIRSRLASHWNIIPLLASGRDQVATWLFPRPYLVEPIIPGQTVADLVTREGAQPLDKSLTLLGELLDGLEHIHSYGFAHGNLRPSSILLDRRGVVHLTNFGTELDAEKPDFNLYDNRRFGEFVWFAPEHLQKVHLYASGKPEAAREILTDTRLDIYAVGMLFYYLLTGEVPFSASAFLQPGQIATATLHFPAQLPASVRDVVTRCLAADPRQRFQSVAALRQALPTPTADFDDLALAASLLATG
ncbi:MAG: protein kinase [Ardenticatenaceae bacterium]|nr:protein kinase [Ardenticatenaceae bacterium]